MDKSYEKLQILLASIEYDVELCLESVLNKNISKKFLVSSADIKKLNPVTFEIFGAFICAIARIIIKADCLEYTEGIDKSLHNNFKLIITIAEECNKIKFEKIFMK